MKAACRATKTTLCAPCTVGTFTAHLNGLDECLQCRVCDPGESVGLATAVPSPRIPPAQHSRGCQARPAQGRAASLSQGCPLLETLQGTLRPRATPVSF